MNTFLQFKLKFVMRTRVSPSIRIFTKVLQIREFVNVTLDVVFYEILSLKTNCSNHAHQMQLTCLKRSRTTLVIVFAILLKHNLPLLTFENLKNVVSAISYIFKMYHNMLET